MKPTILLVVSIATAFLTGCVATTVERPVYRTGPNRVSVPSHAPAHGHRQRIQGVDMIYHQDVACYSLLGHQDSYFADDHFLRWRADRWEGRRHWNDRWQPVDANRISERLRHRHRAVAVVVPPAARNRNTPPEVAEEGYNFQFRGVTLVYREALGAYTVKKHRRLYYHDGRWYQRTKGDWTRAERRDEEWVAIGLRALPRGLRKLDRERREGQDTDG